MKRSFMSTIYKEHPHLPQQFSFYLTAAEEQPSKLVFGDPDLAQHSKESEFRYGKGYYMEGTGQWLTSVWSIGLAGTGVEVSWPHTGTLGMPALIDSGSSLIVLAPDIYDRLLAELQWRFTGCHELPEQQVISCDCPPANDVSRVPVLVINIIDADDRQFPLCMSPDEYILEHVEDSLGRTSCMPSLQRGSANQPVPMIFGMTFMRSFYTNFDVENRRIGFARSKNSPLPANPMCSAEARPLVRRSLWASSAVLALLSLVFAAYVLLAPGCR